MIIGFHYHVPAIEKNGKIYIPGYLGTFLDGLANNCDELICFLHSPKKNELDSMDYEIQTNNIKLINIGAHDKIFKRTFNYKKYLKIIDKNISNLDLMLIRAPSPLLPFIAFSCLKQKVKYSYLIVGDYVKNLKGAINMNPIKKIILHTYYKSNKYYQDKYAKEALLFTNNPIIFNEYKNHNIHEIRTTTLSENDFVLNNKCCSGDDINLIYAGRIEAVKGIEDILDSIVILKEKNISVIFNLVGWDVSKNEEYLKFVKSKVKQLGIEENFIFHGKKKVGDELFNMYRQSDIFISATRGDEGFPRTIWEAMANSTLVIATKVGSIPYMLEDNDNAILIDKNSPLLIAQSIIKVINTPKLRTKLINNAFELASTNTIEMQSQNMIKIMQRYLNNE